MTMAADYAIDNVSLTNGIYGWALEETTSPYVPHSHSLVDFNTSGRDGTVQIRGFVSTPTITLSVTTPSANHDLLRQLMTLGSILSSVSDSSRSLTIEAVTITSVPLSTSGDLIQVIGVFRVPKVYWRDVNPTTYGPTALSTTGQTVNVFGPSTAPVRDALICVAGSITGLAVQASLGTYFSYAPNVPAGQYLTFDAASGRAWTGTTPFAKTTEVTTNIQNGPGPYFLECVGTSNPYNLGTNLIVTWSSASGATIRAQGANAYNY